MKFNPDPKTKSLIRFYFWVLMAIVWVLGAIAGIVNMAAYRNGSPSVTATQTEPINEHGRAHYITRAESDDVRHFTTAFLIAAGSTAMTGLLFKYWGVFSPSPDQNQKAS